MLYYKEYDLKMKLEPHFHCISTIEKHNAYSIEILLVSLYNIVLTFVIESDRFFQVSFIKTRHFGHRLYTVVKGNFRFPLITCLKSSKLSISFGVFGSRFYIVVLRFGMP